MQRQSSGLCFPEATLVAAAFLLSSEPANANVLVPAAFVVAGASVPFAPAILVVEAVVAKRVLGLSAVRSLVLALLANFVSAGLGLPLLGPLMFLDFRGSLDQTALLLILLSLPLCPLSIWVEAKVAQRVLRNCPAGECERWSREANLASYGIVVGSSLVIVLADSLFRTLRYY